MLHELGTVYLFFNPDFDRTSAFMRAYTSLLLFRRDPSRVLCIASSSTTKELLREMSFIFSSLIDDQIVALLFGPFEDSLLKRGEVVVYAF